MYSGVPKMSPLVVRRASTFEREMPKSSTFTMSVPSSLRMMKMLSGLRSRCTTSRSWARAMPRAIWIMMGIARIRSIAPGATISPSERPSSSSMAMYQEPSELSPSSSTSMMFGWLRRRALRASRLKRSRIFSLLAKTGRRILMATTRSRVAARAR